MTLRLTHAVSDPAGIVATFHTHKGALVYVEHAKDGGPYHIHPLACSGEPGLCRLVQDAIYLLQWHAKKPIEAGTWADWIAKATIALDAIKHCPTPS